ncbi:cytochrome c oxidase assembly protein [Taylorella asinigenitalis]|uniref:Putative inner membrane protein n=1 Tax=Taylorella asinigenitalis (strain MCE3) TaxID=1008459 RepID=G4QBM0_TAYAM|nr:cytochrome c oxidase assembly protein [Taylorella asinigenitalis]AEP36998.1 putative inner membrane protein [Taylorella asinigenitalis MCE3]
MNLSILHWLTPWEFSPTLLVLFFLAALLFLRGQSKVKVNLIRKALFWFGFVLLYLAIHTHLDYYAERVFFVHRAQHVVLHHLAPIIIMGSYPLSVFKAGLPSSIRKKISKFWDSKLGGVLYKLGTNKYFIPFMFVFLVLIWLVPSIQFYSMLDQMWYRIMNWSVVVSGFLYWHMILDRRSKPLASMSHLSRVISPIISMVPQIIAGVWISSSERDLFPLFDLCGRALPVTPLEDQALGGLIMWLPAAIIESFGFVAALAIWLNRSSKGR